MGVSRRQLSFNIEKQILVNLITNTEYCAAVIPALDERYFKSKYSAILISWIKYYFNTYHKAPQQGITDIFLSESASLDADVKDQISTILEHLSEDIEQEAHNTEYLVDAAHNFLKKKHLELQIQVASTHLEKNDTTKAELALTEKYKGKQQSNAFLQFNDPDLIYQSTQYLISQQSLDDAFFRFHGRLGEFIGPVDKGWLVSFLAPPKRGKTTYMMESLLSAIQLRRNTIFISLEMPAKQLYARYMLAVTGERPEDLHSEETEETVMIPLMDCRENQNGMCSKQQRRSTGIVAQDEFSVVPYETMPHWKPCTECRKTPDFIPATWKVPLKRRRRSEADYIKRVEKFNRYFAKYARIAHFPSKSVTVPDLQNEVQLIIEKDNFVPEVIIIDYGDLIAPEGKHSQKRHELDDVWESLRAWGQSSRALIITASQTNRESANAVYLKDTQVAEDFSKIAKLDIGIGLCQSDPMKELGMLNINIVAHRHHPFIPSRFCTVLQELSTQQAVLDSEFIVNN